jgi:translation initiation factor 1
MKEDSKLVYSTTGEQKDQRKSTLQSGYQQSSGPLKVRLETQGRGGKAVTVLFNLPFQESEAKEVKSALAQKFGCSATLKNSTIELRGDFRSQVLQWAESRGLECVKAGG